MVWKGGLCPDPTVNAGGRAGRSTFLFGREWVECDGICPTGLTTMRVLPLYKGTRLAKVLSPSPCSCQTFVGKDDEREKD